MKNITYLLLFISFTLTLATSCDNVATAENDKATNVIFKDINAQEFKEMLEAKKAIPIDVRTPAEYEKERIPAVEKNIDYKNRLFMIEMQKLDKNQPYMIHCLSGLRSGRAMMALKSMGFKEVYNLDKGLKGWKNSGFETISAGADSDTE